MQPYFSIIIPTLNEESFIGNLLQDLKRQTEKNFEVLVVDGNSADKTREIVEAFIDKLPVSFIVSDKRNVSYQRNLGARNSTGQYFVFLDADYRINSGYLLKLRKEIQKHKHLVYIPAIEPLNGDRRHKIYFKFINYGTEFSQNLTKAFSTGGTSIFQNYFFHHLGGFDDKLFIAEDHEIIQRARAMGVYARFVKSAKVKISLRRLERDGFLDMFKKYSISILHMYTKGKVDKKLYEYEMGGHRYLTKKETKQKTLQLKKMYNTVLKRLNQIV